MFQIQFLLLLLVLIHNVLTSEMDNTNSVELENLSDELDTPWLVEEKETTDNENAIFETRSVITGLPTNGVLARIINSRGYYLAITKSGRVYGNLRPACNTRFQILVYNQYTVRLKNVASQQYIAISCQNGKVYGTHKLTDESLLKQALGMDSWQTFRSHSCPQTQNLSNFWYLGIKRGGKYKSATTTTSNDKAAKFQLVKDDIVNNEYGEIEHKSLSLCGGAIIYGYVLLDEGSKYERGKGFCIQAYRAVTKMSEKERKVKFPHSLVFKEVVKDGDSGEIVEFLKRPSVDTGIVNTAFASSGGRTALHEFVRGGNLKCVRALVNLGADVNLHDCTGWTPLHYCSVSDDLRVARFLLIHGANPDILSYDGKAPVDYTDNFEMIELLTSYSNQ